MDMIFIKISDASY